LYGYDVFNDSLLVDKIGSHYALWQLWKDSCPPTTIAFVQNRDFTNYTSSTSVWTNLMVCGSLPLFGYNHCNGRQYHTDIASHIFHLSRRLTIDFVTRNWKVQLHPTTNIHHTLCRNFRWTTTVYIRLL
jgi:hypothetical protein